MEISKYIFINCAYKDSIATPCTTIAMMSFLLEHHCFEQAQLSQKLEGFFSTEMLM